jgi:transposase
MTKVYLKQNVGIDVGKKDLKVCLSIMDSDFTIEVKSQKVYTNDSTGWIELEKWLHEHRLPIGEPLRCTMEATGVYYENLAYYLQDKGFILHVVLPNRSKSYGKSLGQKSKTDKIDARTLAQMGLERNLRVWHPLKPVFKDLRQLTRERERLSNTKTILSNQLHSCKHEAMPKSSTIQRINAIITLCKEQIKEIDEEIVTVINKNEGLKKKLSYLQSINGVGILTAVTIAAETNGFSETNSIKQLISYSGYDVQIMESGAWKGKSRISKRGNRHIRRALYMPTLTKIHYDSFTKTRYEKLKERKGIPMKAVTAESRKLLGLMFTLWNKEEMYISDYENNKKKASGNTASQVLTLDNGQQEKGKTDAEKTVENDTADRKKYRKKSPATKVSSADNGQQEKGKTDAEKTVENDTADRKKYRKKSPATKVSSADNSQQEKGKTDAEKTVENDTTGRKKYRKKILDTPISPFG